jgi:hypothetical protein
MVRLGPKTTTTTTTTSLQELSNFCFHFHLNLLIHIRKCTANSEEDGGRGAQVVEHLSCKHKASVPPKFKPQYHQKKKKKKNSDENTQTGKT